MRYAIIPRLAELKLCRLNTSVTCSPTRICFFFLYCLKQGTRLSSRSSLGTLRNIQFPWKGSCKWTSNSESIWAGFEVWLLESAQRRTEQPFATGEENGRSTLDVRTNMSGNDRVSVIRYGEILKLFNTGERRFLYRSGKPGHVIETSAVALLGFPLLHIAT
jgi:hypothetical protein